MSSPTVRKFLTAGAVFFSVWLGIKYLAPLLFPFFIGTALALAAEPVVSLGQQHFRLPRWFCSGVGVTLTIILLSATIYLLFALLFRQLGYLAQALPDVQESANQGIGVLQEYLLSLSSRTPQSIRPVLTQTVTHLFDGSSAVVQQIGGRIPSVITTFLSRIPDRALGFGTGLLAAFMISARLSQIRSYLARCLPPAWKQTYLPALSRLRKALGSWLKAQLKLMLITCTIVALGLFLLRVPYALIWAVLIALVDAVPVLGTGTVLLPWAFVNLLRGLPVPALGILCIYIVCALTRSILEPRFVGRELGIDPLVTLVFFYVGYKFFGFWGILLAPLLATAVKTLAEKT